MAQEIKPNFSPHNDQTCMYLRIGRAAATRSSSWIPAWLHKRRRAAKPRNCSDGGSAHLTTRNRRKKKRILKVEHEAEMPKREPSLDSGLGVENIEGQRGRTPRGSRGTPGPAPFPG